VTKICVIFSIAYFTVFSQAWAGGGRQKEPSKAWDAKVKLVNFQKEEEKKILKAVKLLKKIITSKIFRERIQGYTYNGKKEFVDNQGLTNEEIYYKILDGAEHIGNTAKNSQMDVEIELYHQMSNTIGYTYPHTSRIWMNRKYFSRYNPVKIADNLMHEWMHKLGFTHPTRWTKDRDHTVPYAVGYLIEELSQKLSE
jgi:hypothetical protein